MTVELLLRRPVARHPGRIQTLSLDEEIVPIRVVVEATLDIEPPLELFAGLRVVDAGNEVDMEMSTWEYLKDNSLSVEVGLRDQVTWRVTNTAAFLGMNVNEAPGNEEVTSQVRDELADQDKNSFGYWGVGAENIRWTPEGEGLAVEMWGGWRRALQEAGYGHIEYGSPKPAT